MGLANASVRALGIGRHCVKHRFLRVVESEDAEAMESGSGDGVYVGSDAYVWRGALVLASCRRLSLAFPCIRKKTYTLFVNPNQGNSHC